MKVLLINGSPHENGNTRRALDEVAKTLQEEGVETITVNLGKNAVQGCIACGWCGRTGRCTYNDALYTEIRNVIADGIDGLIIGSPVYYGGPNGSLCALMDRVCYSLSRYLLFKPAASVVVCRRGGATAAFQRLNMYFTMLNMPVVSSQYWNMAYGHTAGEVERRRRHADHADTGTQYGMDDTAAECCRGWTPDSGNPHADKFYQIKASK